jgi:hypothetical protein
MAGSLTILTYGKRRQMECGNEIVGFKWLVERESSERSG